MAGCTRIFHSGRYPKKSISPSAPRTARGLGGFPREGLGALARGGVILLPGRPLDLNLPLAAGPKRESVEVPAPVPLVGSASAEVRTPVDSRQGADLPLKGRNTAPPRSGGFA